MPEIPAPMMSTSTCFGVGHVSMVAAGQPIPKVRMAEHGPSGGALCTTALYAEDDVAATVTASAGPDPAMRPDRAQPRPDWLDEFDSTVLATSPAPIASAPGARGGGRPEPPRQPVLLGLGECTRSRRPHAAEHRTGAAEHRAGTGAPRHQRVSLDAYRVGEGVAWRRLMEIAFELPSDPAELHEMLDVCSRSISAFVDATLAGIAAQIDLERDDLTRSTHAERRETIASSCSRAPRSPGSAPRRGWAMCSPEPTPRR